MATRQYPETAPVISDKSAVALPIKNLIGLLGGVAIGVYAYFGIQERISNLETNYKLIATDIEKNIEFRIKWPRGELGSLPADSEQFMLIEHMAGMLDKIEKQKEACDTLNQFILKYPDHQLIEKTKSKINEIQCS